VLPFYNGFPIRTPELLNRDPLLAAFDLDYEPVEKQLDLIIESLESHALRITGIRAVIATEVIDFPDYSSLFPSRQRGFQAKASLLMSVDSAVSNSGSSAAGRERRVLEWGSCPKSDTTVDTGSLSRDLEVSNKRESQPYLQLVEVFFDNDDLPADTPLAQLWRGIVGEIVVPFDLDERRRRFEQTYKFLRPYIDAYLKGERQLDSRLDFPGRAQWFWVTGESADHEQMRGNGS
jgi:hypothetical protein